MVTALNATREQLVTTIVLLPPLYKCTSLAGTLLLYGSHLGHTQCTHFLLVKLSVSDLDTFILQMLPRWFCSFVRWIWEKTSQTLHCLLCELWLPCQLNKYLVWWWGRWNKMKCFMVGTLGLVEKKSGPVCSLLLSSDGNNFCCLYNQKLFL